MKKKENKFLFALTYFLIVIFLCGCSGNVPPEERFAHSEERGDGYDTYGGYDVRELEQQVEGYWDYFNENEKEKELKIDDINNWNGHWIKGGKYKVGEDIEEGLYICKNIDNISSGDVTVETENVKEGPKEYYWVGFMSYIFLKNETVVTIDERVEIASADTFTLPKINEDIYYEGSYKVGEEIPKGEYFMLSMDVSSGIGLLSNEKNQTIGLNSRFGYVTISDNLAVNLEHCILISLDQKPKIRPIQYQSQYEGKGYRVYAAGMYRVGKDLPIGTYKIKNELYTNVTDLAFEGYHGNETYYPGYWNWCGLMMGSEEQARHLDWLEIELDSYMRSKKRYLKITNPQQEVSYHEFEGFPTITFTEKDIGNDVKALRCVLIPEARMYYQNN